MLDASDVLLTGSLPISERLKAFYFVCGMVPGIWIALIRMMDAYDDPSLLLSAVSSLLYVGGVFLLLVGGRTIGAKKYLIAVTLLLPAAAQWIWETVDYLVQYDGIRAAGRATAIGAIVRVVFLMAVAVAIQCGYRVITLLSSERRFSEP
jgi:hypothetical protein